MRIVFIGSVEFSRRMLAVCLDAGVQVVGVVAKPESAYNVDFVDLACMADAHGLDLLHTKCINAPETLAWAREHRPDVIFCFGWSSLLGRELLAIPPLGVVGYHPAMLPSNRGRHPLIWALALGLECTGSTFFFMDEGADSGDILSQSEMPIAYEDDAAVLYERMCATAAIQVREFLPSLADGSYVRVPQDSACANAWRKRGRSDGRIDFRMTSRAIYNLVRALTRPYPGAHVETPEGDVTVWKIRECAIAPANLEPGKVLWVRDGGIGVKCGLGAVELVEHEFEVLPNEGDYL
ncbi:formyltransferase family protein [Desulfocurvus sp. DL9XJH121]